MLRNDGFGRHSAALAAGAHFSDLPFGVALKLGPLLLFSQRHVAISKTLAGAPGERAMLVRRQAIPRL